MFEENETKKKISRDSQPQTPELNSEPPIHDQRANHSTFNWKEITYPVFAVTDKSDVSASPQPVTALPAPKNIAKNFLLWRVTHLPKRLWVQSEHAIAGRYFLVSRLYRDNEF
jgi:hypothetical protein